MPAVSAVCSSAAFRPAQRMPPTSTDTASMAMTPTAAPSVGEKMPP